jgi:DNA-binding SARP family transcriptional activator
LLLAVQFALLGPVAARDDGRELQLGGPKQRALLAILLLHANTVVSRDRLIEGVWGERPPPTADHTLDNYVSRLRKTLGDDRISRRPPGYVLHVHAHELDLERFRTLMETGRGQLARNEPTQAATTLRSALALWRGPALADVLYVPFASEEAQRLEDLRLSALENRIEADLELGSGAELVGELESLVRDHPFRERFLGQLMLALYSSGRQTEALSAFQNGRQRLAEELGLEPGPELHDLQRRILEHDETLRLPRRRRPGASARTRPSATMDAVAAAWGKKATAATSAIAKETRRVRPTLGEGFRVRLIIDLLPVAADPFALHLA